MFKLWFRITTGAAALGLALVSTGCDESMVPTAPVDPGTSASPEIRLVEAKPAASRATDASFYLQGQTRAWDVKVIGRDGGTLSVNGHTLIVPAGAVSGPTRFVMKDDVQGYIGVDLSATSCRHWVCSPGQRGKFNDVGSAGFAVPLTLKLSYAHALLVLDEDNLKVVYLLGNSLNSNHLEPQPSSVDKDAKEVIGTIDHFSRYAVGEQ